MVALFWYSINASLFLGAHRYSAHGNPVILLCRLAFFARSLASLRMPLNSFFLFHSVQFFSLMHPRLMDYDAENYPALLQEVTYKVFILSPPSLTACSPTLFWSGFQHGFLHARQRRQQCSGEYLPRRNLFINSRTVLQSLP